jgi:hypothetical protein
MVAFIGFLICAIGTAVNVAIFAATGSAINIGAAVLCGLCAVFNLTMIRKV